MKIQVKQEHIDRGKRNKASSCPIALAAKECIPGAMDVVVFSNLWAKIKGQPITKGGLLPFEATQFVIAFDRQQPVEPFEFEFEFQF